MDDFIVRRGVAHNLRQRFLEVNAPIKLRLSPRHFITEERVLSQRGFVELLMELSLRLNGGLAATRSEWERDDRSLGIRLGRGG